MSTWTRVVPCHDAEAFPVCLGVWRCPRCRAEWPDYAVWWRSDLRKQLRPPIKPNPGDPPSTEVETRMRNAALYYATTHGFPASLFTTVVKKGVR